MSMGLTFRRIYLFPHSSLRTAEPRGGGPMVTASALTRSSIRWSHKGVVLLLLFLLSIDLNVAHRVLASAGETTSAFTLSKDVL